VGPIDIDGAGVSLDGSNTAEFLLRRQYRIDDKLERVDLLEEVAREVVVRMLERRSPDPIDLGRALAGHARSRRLLAWAQKGAEQTVISSVGMDGSLPNPERADGVSFAIVNGSGGKIDAYLDTEFEYDAHLDGASRVAATASLRLRNDLPDDELPEYVVTNLAGFPNGTSWSLVTIYTTLPAESATLDGVVASPSSSVEHGLHAYSFWVEIPPGETAELRVELEGVSRTPSHRLEAVLPALANDVRWVQRVTPAG
jgi:hypothetical protein